MNEEKTPFIENLNKQQTSAYHQLYDEYYKVLVLYAINFLSSQQAAEDIVQELFATMWEKKMKFLSLPSFRTYLYNSVRNASLNYLKHQNVESLYLEHLANTYRESIPITHRWKKERRDSHTTRNFNRNSKNAKEKSYTIYQRTDGHMLFFASFM